MGLLFSPELTLSHGSKHYQRPIGAVLDGWLAHDDILAVEVERSRSGTKRGSMKLVDSLLTHARSLDEGRWHRVRYACRTPQITERVSRCFASLGLEDYREAFQFTTEPALFH